MIEQNIKKGIRLSGNRDSIVQLMTVLLDNAVKYTESGGVIRAELYGNEKNITLSIANTCEPAHQPPQTVRPHFYRGDSLKRRKTAAVVGLSVARGNDQPGSQRLDNRFKMYLQPSPSTPMTPQINKTPICLCSLSESASALFSIADVRDWNSQITLSSDCIVQRLAPVKRNLCKMTGNMQASVRQKDSR